MSYADKLWMFNVRDPNKVRKTLLNLARSSVSLNENNFLLAEFNLYYYNYLYNIYNLIMVRRKKSSNDERNRRRRRRQGP